MSCSKCSKDLPVDGDHVKCFGCDCNYHYKCSGLSKSTYAAKSQATKETWRCQKCKTENKSGNSTPNSEVIKDPSFAFAIDEVNLKSSIIKEVRETLREEFAIFKEIFAKEVSLLKETIASLKQRCDEKDTIIDQLTLQVNNQNQYSRNKNFEIINVEEAAGENIEEIVMKIANKLNVDLNVNDIDCAHRLPAKNNRTSRIIVQLTTRKKRDLIINNRRNLHITSEELTGVKGQRRGTQVFVNENLSPFFRELLWRSKQRAKECGHRFVWFSNGKVLVKKEEQSRQVIRIQSFKDIDRLIKSETSDPV